MTEGTIVGRVGIQVSPDLSRFRSDLKRTLARMRESVSVRAVADTTGLRAEVTAGVAKATAGVKAEIETTLGRLASLRARIVAAVERATAGVRAEIPVVIDRKSLASLGNAIAGGGGGSPGRLLAQTWSSVAKSMVVLAAAGSAVKVLAGAGAALSQLAPAALLAPGALLALGAIFGTVKAAFSNFGDAVGGSAEAMANLAPNARLAAKAVQGIKAEFSGIQQSIQGEFFQGLSTDIERFGKGVLPVLRSELPQVAGSLRVMTQEALRAAQTPFFQGNLANVLSNTSGMLSNMASSVGNLMSGFVGLGSIGSDYLPRLGVAIDNVSARFQAWVSRGIDSGQIHAMIDGAIQGFKDLGAIVTNIGTIISTVLTGMGVNTAGPLAGLRQLTADMATFLQTASAQGALQTLGTVLTTAGEALRSVFLTGLQVAIPLIQILGPVVTSVLAGIQEFPGVFLAAGAALLGLKAAIAAATAGIALYNGVMTVVRVATAVWTGVQWALNAALTANPIGLIVVAIAALVAGIIWAWNSSETFRTVVLAVWEAVKTGVTVAVDAILVAIEWLGQLPGKVIGWFEQLGEGAISALTSLVSWVTSIPGRILDALGDLGSLLLDSGKALVDGFLNGIKSAWNKLLGWVERGMAHLRGLWPFSPAKHGPFSGMGYVTYSGKALMEDFAKSIRKGSAKVLRSAHGVMDDVNDVFGGRAELRALDALDATLSASLNPKVSTSSITNLVTQFEPHDKTGDLVAALEAAEFKFDGNGIARIVNLSNRKKGRR